MLRSNANAGFPACGDHVCPHVLLGASRPAPPTGPPLSATTVRPVSWVLMRDVAHPPLPADAPACPLSPQAPSSPPWETLPSRRGIKLRASPGPFLHTRKNRPVAPGTLRFPTTRQGKSPPRRRTKPAAYNSLASSQGLCPLSKLRTATPLYIVYT